MTACYLETGFNVGKLLIFKLLLKALTEIEMWMCLPYRKEGAEHGDLHLSYEHVQGRYRKITSLGAAWED